MAYFLIIIGVVCAVIGIIMLSTNKNSNPSEAVSQTNNSSGSTRQQVENTITDERTDNNRKLSAKEIGDTFEDFVVNLLVDWRLSLLDRTQDRKTSAGVVAESSKNPDLHVRQKRGKSDIDYYIECKYRSEWENGAVTFEDWQLDRYRQFQRDNHRKVLIALGVGGTPSSPATLRIVPLDSIKGNSISEIKTIFAVSPNSDAFISYIDSYFDTVFAKSKSRKPKEN